jgi:hypothetical protein
MKCFHLAVNIFDIFLRIIILKGWCYAREYRMGCGLDNAVHAAGCGVKVTLGLASEVGP